MKNNNKNKTHNTRITEAKVKKRKQQTPGGETDEETKGTRRRNGGKRTKNKRNPKHKRKKGKWAVFNGSRPQQQIVKQKQ